NDAPAGTNGSVTTDEDTQYVFDATDLGLTDPLDSPVNSLLAVKVTTLPGVGTLKDNNVAVTAGQFVSVADINGGKLTFDPAANANATGYASFTFQVQDNGCSFHSGVDLHQSPSLPTRRSSDLNDAPAGTNGSVTTDED